MHSRRSDRDDPLVGFLVSAVFGTYRQYAESVSRLWRTFTIPLGGMATAIVLLIVDSRVAVEVCLEISFTLSGHYSRVPVPGVPEVTRHASFPADSFG